MIAHKLRAIPFGAKSKIFDLHHRNDGVVVVGLEQVNVVGGAVGHGVEFIYVHGPTAAQLDVVSAMCVVSLDRPAKGGVGQITVNRFVFRH